MWNYRVIKFVEDKEEWFEISEVYYNAFGKPEAYCRATVGEGDMDALKETLNRMMDCENKPILKSTEFAKRKTNENIND